MSAGRGVGVGAQAGGCAESWGGARGGEPARGGGAAARLAGGGQMRTLLLPAAWPLGSWPLQAPPTSPSTTPPPHHPPRAVRLSSDTRSLLSGGADTTLRLWDLRRALHAMCVVAHSDSVWAIEPADGAFTAAYTGGRDGCVYRWGAVPARRWQGRMRLQVGRCAGAALAGTTRGAATSARP